MTAGARPGWGSADRVIPLVASLTGSELPARQALSLVSDLAAVDGVAGDVLLALTGRSSLPDGFSVM